MRHQGQHYHQGVNAHGEQMRHVSSQRIDHSKSSSSNYQRREQGMGSERGHDYVSARDEEQWRSERDGSTMRNPHMLNEDYPDGLDKPDYQDHRSGFQSGFGDDRHLSYQPRQEDLDIPFADDSMSRGLKSIENKFLDEIMKLVKEQKEAEDAEYTRHKEKLDTINIQYQEQLTTLRANQACRREVLLQNETNARQQQYQQAMAYQYSIYSMPPNNYLDASPTSAAPRHALRQQQQCNPALTGKDKNNTDTYKYNQRNHFSSGPEDHHRAETQNSYHSGRIYDNSREFYRLQIQKAL